MYSSAKLEHQLEGVWGVAGLEQAEDPNVGVQGLPAVEATVGTKA